MANTKISALTSSTTPLAGTEVLPIVQSSATVKVSVSNLTAGRSVSATSFVPTGSTIPANGLYLPAANSVGIATNTTNVIYIDSSGNVGLNQPIPTVKWDIVGNGGIVSKFQNYAASAGIDSYVAEGTSAAPTALLSGRQIMNYRNFGYDGASYIFVGGIDMQAESAFSVGANPTYMRFRVSPTSGTGREVLRLNSTGAVVLLGGSTTATGVGIAFPATQSASSNANTLDDYEEGTWTPTLVGFTTSGTLTLTGSYVKIGRLVTLTWRLQSTVSITSAVSSTLTGLPFTTTIFGTGSSGISGALSGGINQLVNDVVYFTQATTSADWVGSGFYYTTA